MEAAPFRNDLAEGPRDVSAVWATAEDEVRLRVAIWPVSEAHGTVLLFPGRTEYVEKYGRVARDLTAAGYAVVAIDWRGQGFSDRLADDRLLGHVLRFGDYQKDVAALLAQVEAAALPGPRFLLAHSMGGCIGLRALMRGLAVRRAVFSAPMWGIEIRPSLRPVAHVLPGLARLAGQHLRYTPGNRPVIYDAETGFDENPLTSDRDHFDYLVRQITSEDQFGLGGPSLHWLGEALKETRALRAGERPSLPVRTWVGTDEIVVSVPAILQVHANWQQAELDIFPDARHELMMESTEIRGKFLSEALSFFDAEPRGQA